MPTAGGEFEQMRLIKAVGGGYGRTNDSEPSL